MSVFSFSAEIKSLIEDLDLIPLSSSEAQSALRAYRVRLFLGCTDFDEVLRLMANREDPSSQVYENLCEVYYKYNRKGSRRTFGSSFDLQLTLDF